MRCSEVFRGSGEIAGVLVKISAADRIRRLGGSSAVFTRSFIEVVRSLCRLSALDVVSSVAPSATRLPRLDSS